MNDQAHSVEVPRAIGGGVNPVETEVSVTPTVPIGPCPSE